MRSCAVFFCLAGLLTLNPARVDAQARPQPPAPPGPVSPVRPAVPPPAVLDARGFVTFGVGAQMGTSAFSETHKDFIDQEERTWTADYSVKSGLAFEAGGGWQLWRNLFAAGTYTRFGDSRSAAVNGEIPHPFFFDRPRHISGDSPSLAHDEQALHLSALWLAPAGRRLEVAVFGGPSIMNVSQEMVKEVRYEEEYPYDTATFTQALTDEASRTVLGFHVGGDVTWLLSRQLGLGGAVRYNHASVELDTPSGGTIDLDAGGAQVMFTLKLRILSKRPMRVPPSRVPPRATSPLIAPPAALSAGVLTASAPVFLRPDATMTPLRQLAPGTRVRVLETRGEWLRVEFEDRQYGRRTGYIQKMFVRVEPR
jgi:hypothetical protein